jgi:hypothetical protein
VQRIFWLTYAGAYWHAYVIRLLIWSENDGRRSWTSIDDDGPAGGGGQHTCDRNDGVIGKQSTIFVQIN